MHPSRRSLRLPPVWAVLTLLSALVLEAELGLADAVIRPAQAPVRVQAALVDPTHVPVRAPVTIVFDRALDSSRLDVGVEPASAVVVTRFPDRMTIAPQDEWLPAISYRLSLKPRPGFDRRLLASGWSAWFHTQPRLSVSGFRVAGLPVGQMAAIGLSDLVEIDLPQAMDRGSVDLMVGGAFVEPASLQWSPEGTAVTISIPGLVPYQPSSVEVVRGATTASGEVLTDGGTLQVVAVAGVPSNPANGLPSGSPGQAPIEVVFDNAPAARPQTGLQRADIVYEYLSEYQVSRMTAIYLGPVPDEVGPVRSCRMVNPYLNFAYQGLTMCSGASVGMLHYMFGNPEGGVLVPGVIADFDRGEHFYRSGSRPSPNNLYTTAPAAYQLRSEVPLGPGRFRVEAAHPDAEIGSPAPAPEVGLHSVSYAYDAASRLYARFDHGVPFVDAGTGGQVQAKNVVLLHVPFRDAGWIEDDNGGAHSIWYDLLGSGPAEVYSDGRVVDATWHMGSAPGQWYYDNRTPVWFSDGAGKPLHLNSGPTWIHVLGNGQTD